MFQHIAIIIVACSVYCLFIKSLKFTDSVLAPPLSVCTPRKWQTDTATPHPPLANLTDHNIKK